MDLYLVHWPFAIEKGAPFPAPFSQRLGYSAERYMGVWRELEKLVDAGKIKALGCSNMSAKKLAALLKEARVPPSVNQVRKPPLKAISY